MRFLAHVILFFSAVATGGDESCSGLPRLSQNPAAMSVELIPVGGELPVEVLNRFSEVELATAIVGRVADKEMQHRLPTALIPPGLDNFQIQRKFGSIYKEQTPRLSLDAKNNAQIIIQFLPDKIDGIKDGFGNVHQGLESMGGTVVKPGEDHDSLYKARRVDVEHEVMGLKLPVGNPKANLIRPKSGWLHIHGAENVGELVPVSVTQYGPLGAVGKRHLHDRSIWVTGDALRELRGKKLSSDPNLASWFSNVGGNNSVHLGTFRSGEFPFSFSPISYIEVLTFGPIAMNDLDHFTIDVTGSQPLEKYAAELGRYGKWVFAVEREERNKRPVMSYKRVLFRGTEAPAEVPPAYRDLLK